MEDGSFILFAYQLPATPSTHRSYVWRKLKSLGALYLQNSVCLLPSGGGRAEVLKALRAEILSRGGGADLLTIIMADADERADLSRRFREQADDEYGEVLEQCEALHEELARERARSHLTWGELEENEAELAKLRSWLARAVDRDFFGAGARARAEGALEGCAEDLGRFAEEVESAVLDGKAAPPPRGAGAAAASRRAGQSLLGGLRRRSAGD